MKLKPRLSASMGLALALTSIVPKAVMAADLDQALARQCVIDVCGPEANFLPEAANGPFGTVMPVGVKDYIKKQIDPKTRAYFSLQSQILKSTLGNSKSLLAQAEKDPLSLAQLSEFAVLTMLMRFTDETNKSLIAGPNDGLKIDVEQFKKKLPNLDPAILEKLVAISNAYLEDDYYHFGSDFQRLPYERFQFYAVKYGLPNEDGKPWADIIKTTIEMANDFSTRVDPLMILPVDIDLLNKSVTSADSLSDGEKQRVMDVMILIWRRTRVASDGVMAAYTKSGLTFEELLKVSGFLQTSDDFEKLAQDKATLKKITTDGFNECRLDVNKAFAAAPSPLRLRQLQALLVNVKAAAHQSTKLYFTGDTLVAADSGVDQVTFVTPPSLENVESRIGFVFDTQKTKLVQTAQAIKALQARPDGWKFLLAHSSFLQSKSMAEVLKQSITSSCEQVVPPGSNDMAMGGVQIQVGWQSVMFPEMGAGVLAHEMGHIVSAMARAVKEPSEMQAFLNTRACSAANHAGLDSSETGQSRATNFQEEDWADAFSSTTMKFLKPVWPYAINMSCGLMLQGEKSEKYSNMSLFTPNSSDTHSQDFYRVLQVQASLGLPMPASCETAVGAKDLKTATNACAL